MRRARGGRRVARAHRGRRRRRARGPGAADAILSTLGRYGFEWDGPVCAASGAHRRAIATALERLQRRGRVYRCACTRRELASRADRRERRARLSGHLSRRHCAPRAPRARGCDSRARSGGATIAFAIACTGRSGRASRRDVGDFVVRRARRPLRVSARRRRRRRRRSAITDVVRGADLLASTPRQILLQQALGLPTPSLSARAGRDRRARARSCPSRPARARLPTRPAAGAVRGVAVSRAAGAAAGDASTIRANSGRCASAQWTSRAVAARRRCCRPRAAARRPYNSGSPQ